MQWNAQLLKLDIKPQGFLQCLLELSNVGDLRAQVEVQHLQRVKELAFTENTGDLE